MYSIPQLNSIMNSQTSSHIIYLYETEWQHQEFFTFFLSQGLKCGEKILYIVDLNSKNDIYNYLRNVNIDIEQYLANGQFLIITSNETYIEDGFFDINRMINFIETELERAGDDGYPATRITSEMTWSLKKVPGSEQLINYEYKMNDILLNNKCHAVCQYNINLFSPVLLINLLATHPTIAISVGDDITVYKKGEEKEKYLDEEIRRQDEKLRELEQLKDQFFEDISHEIRTPLTSIKGYTELLLKSKNFDNNELEDLKTIYRNELRLERLINELINYKRLKANLIQFKKDIFKVSELINMLKRSYEVELLQKHLKIVDYYEYNEHLALDKEQTTRLIRILIDNAIKFSNPKSKIEIKSKIKSNKWIFSISDYGIGIKKEDIPLLFSRFNKLENSCKNNLSGLGLGLATCKSILAKYNGRIWVKSPGLDKGTTFFFEIPLNQ